MSSKRHGFSFIELMIAIAVVGIMMTAIVPLLQQDMGYERKQFIARLNSLVQLAWQQAIITHDVHRVLFDFKEHTAIIERNTTPSSTDKKLTFEPIKDPYATMRWAEHVVIRQFIIEGYDKLKRSASRATNSAWFYIIPDGMTQQVTINGIDKHDLFNNRPRQFGLVLNPFMAQFKEYDTFQK